MMKPLLFLLAIVFVLLVHAPRLLSNEPGDPSTNESGTSITEETPTKVGSPTAGGSPTADGTVFGPDSSLASPSEQKSKPENKKLTLVDFFSVEKNPGGGTLNFTRLEQVEKIQFGSEGGVYGLAMVFHGRQLPPPYGIDFADETIIQIALGRLKSKIEGQIPQFGAAMLVGKKLQVQNTNTFPIVVPQTGKKNTMKNLALLMFTPPSTPIDRTDEEKLKNTFFTQTGSITLSKQGKTTKIKVRAQDQDLWFNMSPMKMKIDVTLFTPFSADKTNLKGTIQLPLYSPFGNAAVEFTQRIASTSLEGPIGLSNSFRNSRKPSGEK